jgi:predicted RNA-binding protein with PUA-like domain
VAHWLVKQEPSSYSWAHLVRDGRTRWDGVHNALALQHLRRMAVGDEALFYHSGAERACVGILRIASEPQPDPDDARGSWFVEVTPVRPLAHPVTLSEIRGDPMFKGLALLRISRLSVMPIPKPSWDRILERARSADPRAPTVKAGTKPRSKRPAPRRPGTGRPRRR